MNIQNKIQTYADSFETKQRGNKTIIVLKDNAPEELDNSVMQAHGDRFPSDWIFDTYHSILENLTGYDINSIDDVEDYRHEIVDGLVDIYTHELTGWLHSDNRNVYYLEDAVKEYGASDGFQILMSAQYIAINEIYNEVVELLNE